MAIDEKRLHGVMTTDYFAFICPKCKKEISNIVFIGYDPSITTFIAQCQSCKSKYDFKMNVSGIPYKKIE